MLAMGGALIGVNMMHRIVDTFLETPFEGGRHQRRVDKMMDIETR
jgi:ribose 5-phosphate isomerase B